MFKLPYLLSAADMINHRALEPLVPMAAHHMGRTRYTCGYKPARSRYMPHQGDREIARRQRQAEQGAK